MDNPDGQRQRDSRIYHVGGALLGGMGLLLVGLWYVQVATALVYVENQETQSMRSVRVPAVRGAVLDQHGRPLAKDRPTYVVHAYLEELRHHFRKEWKESQSGADLTAEERANLEIDVRHRVVKRFTDQLGLSQSVDLSPREMQSHFLDQRALPLPVIRDLSSTNIARFMENSWKIPGLEMEVTSKRVYPSTSVAHLMGYLRRDNTDDTDTLKYNYRLPDYKGALGLEKTFNPFLRGQPGTRVVEVNNLGYRQAESLPVPPQPGSNVVLTLDLEIQETAMQAMVDTGAKAGAAVVVEVHSGDVVAMVSMPVFDPNKFTPSISEADWQAYRNARPSPLPFRATQERYPPGSIFKIISGLAALENGMDAEEHVECRGAFRIGRRRIRDTAAPGMYDFSRAFKKSSNYYFIHQAVDQGHGFKHIIKMGNQFSLGQKTGLLPGQEVAGQFPSLADGEKRNWTDGDTANISIGQGPITVTPIQMAMMTATVANGGTLYYPRLVKRIESPDPNEAAHAKRLPKARVRSRLHARQDNLRILRDAMYADVADDDGTGRRARIEGYDVCGKTGTAEVKTPGDPHKITWFTSFAPYESPRYAVVVMVERGISGGTTCAPVAKKIFEALKARDERTAVASSR